MTRLACSEEAAEAPASDYPTRDDLNEWHSYCIGNDDDADTDAETSGHVPEEAVVRSLNQVSWSKTTLTDTCLFTHPLLLRAQLIDFMILTMCDVLQLTVNRLLKWHITWQCEAPILQDRSVQWIYALTSVLEKPLAMSTAAALRDLLRYCAKQEPKSSEDAAKRALLVAISGAYFRQDEHLASLPVVQRC